MNRNGTDLSGLLRRHARTALIGAALIALGGAIVAELVAGDSGNSEPVAAALEAVPEGPDFRVSRGDRQWSDLGLPAVLPEPLRQTCESGINVVLELGDGSRAAYGPCRRPAVIQHLLADLLSIAHGKDLLASVAPGCARKLIADWFDNARVDRLYRRVCYEGALDLLPESVEDLGQAEAVIRRALCAWTVCDANTVAEAQRDRLATRAQHAQERPTSRRLLCLPDAEKPPCAAEVELGGDYVLYTHCGIEWAIFDGRLWLAHPPLLDDGVRGAPPGWSDPAQAGVMRRAGDERAELRAGSLVATFAPAPPAYAREACD